MNTRKASSITPDTKVSALLGDFPETEEALLALSPAFAKLKSSILRKTIARVTSLRQAAQIAGISVSEMVNQLRKAAGLSEMHLAGDAPIFESTPPEWLDRNNIQRTLDARGMIESGGHPLTKALEEVDRFNRNEIYELITPFLPAPLIDVMKTKGCRVWAQKIKENEFRTYISKNNGRKPDA